MSGLLVDTHALLWWLDDDDRITDETQRRLDHERVVVSAASIWEAAIKRALGKLSSPPELLARVEAMAVEILPITGAHGEHAGSLPAHHRDPFDRILVAQAQLENLALVTADARLGAYDVDVIW